MCMCLCVCVCFVVELCLANKLVRGVEVEDLKPVFGEVQLFTNPLCFFFLCELAKKNTRKQTHIC